MEAFVKPRILTKEEENLLEKQNERLVSEFKQLKLEQDACKNWDLFFKRNETKFYKDRHWTAREFSELLSEKLENQTLLEVGCGVGNFLYPLLQSTLTTHFYACDFSPRAIDYVKQNDLYDPKRMTIFICDLSKESLTSHVPDKSIDICSLIFVLSAIHPNKMIDVLKNIHSILKHGGRILFRDYGFCDHAMLRFAPGQKLSDRLYVRQDNTRTYYFILEEIETMFLTAGFTKDKLQYVHRETVNFKEQISVPRIFLQGVFIKL